MASRFYVYALVAGPGNQVLTDEVAKLDVRLVRSVCHGRGSGSAHAVRDQGGQVGEVMAAVSTEPASWLASSTVTAQALHHHEHIIRHLLRLCESVLPLRYGQAMQSDAELQEWLRPQGSLLWRALEQVKGRRQMTLRVWAADDAPPIDSNDTDAEHGGAETALALGPGTRYLAKRRQAWLQKHAVPEIAPLCERLEPLVRASKIERHNGEGRWLASVYHLVDVAESTRYRQHFEDALRGCGPLRITLSGPWAPYAFAPTLDGIA